MAGRRPKGKNLIEAAERRLGVRFRDAALLEQALTHSSARADTDYQRLEFLGDRVLGLVVAEMLYERFPDAPEGELSLRLNGLVNAETLAEVAGTLDLGALIHTGSDVRSLAARKQVNMRADVMEAILAVIYLEGGLEAARGFIHAHWTERSMAPRAARSDPKTALQEWAHQVSGSTPTYRVESREGPDHEPLFTVAVTVSGYDEGRGTGRSKREAEQAAATEILAREGVWAPVDEAS